MPTLARTTGAFARFAGLVVGRPLTPAQAGWLAGVPALLLLAPAMIPGQVFWLGLPAAVIVAGVARVGSRGRGASVVALLLVLLVAGLLLRAWQYQVGWSGVLAVTADAIRRVEAGLSPWNVPYASSLPPGEPFPYGPAVLAWYWPFLRAGLDLRWVEVAGACGLLLGLVATRRLVGLAVAALTPVLWMVASDGSNDTSAGIVLLLALLLVKRGPAAGGVGLGLAGAFKLHALAWAPGLVLLGGWPALAAFSVTTLGAWAPALLLVGPGPILDSLRWAEGIHDQPGWSLAGVVQQASGGTAPPAWPFTVARWAGGALATAVVVLHARRVRPRAPSWGAFLVGGLAIWIVVLYAGWWSTHGYLAQVAPILCWELDELAGLRRPRRHEGSQAGCAAADARVARVTM